MNDNVIDAVADPAAQARALREHRYRSPVSYEIGREKIREFACAVQDFIRRTGMRRRQRNSASTA